MKSEIKFIQKPSDKPFPKLMKLKPNKFQQKNVIILAWFSRDNFTNGVVVYSDSINFKIGYNSTSWNELSFEDFNGEITLSND